MSKRAYISRYLMIIKKLKNKPYTSYEELKDYIENQVGYLQMQDDLLVLGFSKRTFQRDLREIRNLFGIDIMYDRFEKGYFILDAEAENLNFQRMMEAFHLFNSLKLAQVLHTAVHPEKRRPQGTENMHGLIHAINHRQKVRFTYQKFWEEHITHREVCPIALKEAQQRWYLLAQEEPGGPVKSFGLDRLHALEILGQHFEMPLDYSAEESYRHSFGIIGSTDERPADVVLTFTPIQGKYIKSLPLHHSQKILVDNNEELRISLKLYITYDFEMELLRYGDSLKVIKPKMLAESIKAKHENAFRGYGQA